MQKMGGKFSPTEIGLVVTDLLVENFRDIFDVQYTARLEEELDEIEEGKETWTDALAGILQDASPKTSVMPKSIWRTSSGWRSPRTRSASAVALRW